MEGLALGTINLIVLPILGGYWFQYKFNLTHYRAERLTPQRLIFHAGLFALGLVFVARFVIFVAEMFNEPHEVQIELYLIDAILGFVALLLFALVAAGIKQYWPETGLVDDESRIPQSESIPSDELQRLCTGALIILVIIFIVRGVIVALPTTDVLPSELFAIAIFLLLLCLAAWHHQLINKYMDFPFLNIALRIGLFGTTALLAFACFVFDYPTLCSYWAEVVHVPGSGLPIVACGLGLVLWWPLNLLYPYQAANTRLHFANGTNALDRLLYQSSLAQKLLCLSMKDGKVYIGYVQELPPNPEERNSYVEILPVHSGYRDKDTREMKLTTFYESAYQGLVKKDADEEEWLVFLKVLKIDDILSAGRFDPQAYVRFNGAKTTGGESDSLDDASS